jgi:hypothetical protein
MKNVLLSLSSALIAMASFAQLSGTYTINIAQATGGTNYQTFPAAMSALGSQGVNGPCTFNVIEGTYTGQVSMPSSISGTSTTNTVTFQGDASNTNNPVLSNSGYVLYFYNTNLNNITFKDLDMISTSSRTVYLYNYYSTAYPNINILFEDCAIEAGTSSSSYCPVYLYPYYFGSATDFTFDGCEITGGYYGVYFYPYYNQQNCELTLNDCEITGFNSMGLYVYGYIAYPKLTITNNLVQSSNSSNNPYGMYGYYMGAGSEISGNNFELFGTNYTYGVLAYYGQGTASQPIRIHNNIINNTNANASYSQYGLRIGYGYHYKVYHNTMKISNNYGSSYGLYAYMTYANQGNEFKNNIVYTPSTTPYTVYTYGAGTYLDFENNAYYAGGSNEMRLYSATNGTYNTLTAWQTASSSDVGSVAEDPLFSSANDLTPGSTNLNNICDPEGITTDIYGYTRSTTTPDPGAIEFSVPTNNAQPGELITPDAPLCSDDTTISITLVNSGLVALTTCSLNYSINGGTPVSIQWTGNLAPQADTMAELESSITFATGTDLKVWTSMPNGVVDSSANNDTVGVTLYNGLSGTFAIPGDYATFSDAAADLNLKGVCGHVVFNVATGTYSESVAFDDVDGTGEDATITFQSASGNWGDVLLAGTSSPTVSFNGVDWITFKDMKMTTTSGNVVQIPGQSDHVTIDHCWMLGVHTTSNPSYSIVYQAGTGNDLTMINSKFEKGSSWFYSNSGSTSSYKENFVIEDNYMKDQAYGYGYLYYIDGLEMNRNQFRNDSAFASTYAYFPMGYMNYVNNFNITSNYVGATAGQGWYYGMYMINCIGRSNPRSQIANNCITTGNENYQNAYYTLYMSGSGVFDLYNNSFTHAASTNTYTAYINSGGAVRVKNNSFANYASNYALYVYGGFTVTESDHNNFYNPGGGLVYFGTSQYSSLQDYQNATGNDLNSVNTDPNWEEFMNCVTCNDTMSNAGQVLATLTDDIEGNARSVQNPDIGAVEFVSPASFTLGGNDTVCGNEVIVEAGPAQSVTWNVNNQTSTQGSVTLTATNEPVTYNVSVSITTEYCGSASDNAIIRLVPNATLDSTAHMCAEETLDLEPGGGSAATYSWSTGATTSSITVTEAGTYSVNKMEDGCESDATVVVTQSQGVEIADLDACSADLPISIDASIMNGTSYAWSGGSSINTASNDFTDAGNYSVTATDSYGCSSSDDFGLTVLEEPTAAITQTHSANAYFFDGTSSLYISQNTTYLWDFGYNGQTATTPTAQVVYPWSDPNAPTTYTVTLSIDNGCGTDVDQMDITPDPLGIDAIAEGSFGLYPNPATDNVNFILGSAASAQGTVQVLDLAGRTLSSQIIAAGQLTGEVNVSDLASGSYLVKVSVDGITSVNTLIKQ